MKFTLNGDSNITIITFDNTILGETQMADVMNKILVLSEEGKARFVLDMTCLKSISSMGIGMLLTCLLKVRKKNGDIVLANIPEQIMYMFGITQLIPLFTIVNSVEEGLAIFKNLNQNPVK